MLAKRIANVSAAETLAPAIPVEFAIAGGFTTTLSAVVSPTTANVCSAIVAAATLPGVSAGE